MPLLVPPTFADGSPQPVLLPMVVEGFAGLVRKRRTEQDAGFQLEVWKRPKSRRATDAELPDLALPKPFTIPDIDAKRDQSVAVAE
jgi:hypothetical protein